MSVRTQEEIDVELGHSIRVAAGILSVLSVVFLTGGTLFGQDDVAVVGSVLIYVSLVVWLVSLKVQYGTWSIPLPDVASDGDEK